MNSDNKLSISMNTSLNSVTELPTYVEIKKDCCFSIY